MGSLSRFIRLRLPDFLIRIDQIYTGGRLAVYLSLSIDYLVHSNHPIILVRHSIGDLRSPPDLEQGFYVILLITCELLFLQSSFFKLGLFHQIVAICSALAPLFFTYKAVFSTSSKITPSNHHRMMQLYPYDHVLFHPGQICRTCKFSKPARSKHCSVCDVCVAKYDHHCVWIMNCVGQDNIAHFLGMLLSLSFILTYGAYLAYGLLSKDLQDSGIGDLRGSSRRDHWSAGLTWSQYGQRWSWALARDFRLGGVGLIALLTAPLAWAMFGYHIYLIWAGTTTNESAKWSEWRDCISEGLVYKWVGDVKYIAGIQRATEFEPDVHWPIHSHQRLCRSEDGRPPIHDLRSVDLTPFISFGWFYQCIALSISSQTLYYGTFALPLLQFTVRSYADSRYLLQAERLGNRVRFGHVTLEAC